MKLQKVSDSGIITKDGLTKQEVIYKVKDVPGLRYMIYYENSNGFPMGFNYKMSLKIKKDITSKWEWLDDINVLNIGKAPNYFSNEQSTEHCKEFQLKMCKRLKTVYLD